MNANVLAAAFASLLLCGVGVYFATRQAEPASAERTTRTASNAEAEREAERLREENAALRKRVVELENAAPAPKKEPEKPVTKEPDATAELTEKQIESGIKNYARSLQRVMAGKGEKAIADLRALIKRGGPQALKKLKETWADASGDVNGRLIAAHVLAQSGDADSLELVKATLRDPDKGMVDHRLAAHALAFAEVEGLQPILTEIARKGQEPGVRANAAFGLARKGIDEGIDLYMEATDDAFAANQPEALNYLAGFAMLGDKAKPHVRKRLLTYKSETAVLTLIEIVKATKDTGAVEQLNKLAYDASQPVSIQTAAEGAIKALTKKAPAK